MRERKEKDQEGAYSVVENMIVMPVVFLVVYALLFAGFMLHAQCTIESAVRRGVLYAGKLICDPQYEKITAGAIDTHAGELNELSKKEFDFTKISKYEPYRYIPLFSNYFSSGGTTELEACAQEYVQRIIDQNTTWIFTIDTDGIICDAENYVLTQKISMKVKASYHMPMVFRWLGFPETYDLTAESVFTLSDQDEFIRNVDLVADLLGDIMDASGITKAMQKLQEFAGKIFK